jgi:catechol 2,3-dioxygenase-like lactoylglutathione lyase family enzyme
MAVPARISIVTLGVADLGRSIAFYEAIGWRRSAVSQDTIAFFHTAGTVLALYGREALADDAHVPASGEGFRGVTVAVNCDDRAGVDAAFAECVAAGATPVVEPHAAFWGGYSSYVADPDGHLVELAHNPFLPFRDDGTVDLPA